MTAASKISSNDGAVNEHERDANSLDAIQSILTEEEAPAPRRGLRRPKAVEADLPSQVAPLRSKADSLPLLVAPELDMAPQPSVEKPAKRRFSLGRSPKVVKPTAPVKRPKAVHTKSSADAGAVAGIKGFRPKPRHLALGAFVLFVIFRPWLVLGLTVLCVIIITGVFLTVGYDGFWQGMIKFGRWYANRRPARGALLHARLDRFAVAWDGILDRFPEGIVDGLYLPDFGELAAADDRHTEAMDRRLSGLHG